MAFAFSIPFIVFVLKLESTAQHSNASSIFYHYGDSSCFLSTFNFSRSRIHGTVLYGHSKSDSYLDLEQVQRKEAKYYRLSVPAEDDDSKKKCVSPCFARLHFLTRSKDLSAQLPRHPPCCQSQCSYQQKMQWRILWT